MWPIVPIFTCGLERSNFSFAIFKSSIDAETPRRGENPLLPASLRLCVSASRSSSLLFRDLALNLIHDLFRDTGRNFFVLPEMHGEASASLRTGPQFSRITEHLRQRHHR